MNNIEEFLCFTLKFASFSLKPTDLSSIQVSLHYNWHGYRKIRVAVCEINTPSHKFMCHAMKKEQLLKGINKYVEACYGT